MTRWTVCLAGLVTAIAGAVGADTVTLTPEEMRLTTGRAIAAGRPDMALPMAEALLGRDASDAQAHVLRSQALRDLGRAPDAIEAARRGWRLAQSDEIRFGAALAMAQALSSDGKRTRAQLWLRRAAELAPDDRMRALVERDFRYVRRRNPWSTELSFDIAPSSNVNNGSRESSVQLFDLPLEFELSGASKALSGTEIAMGIATSYRLIDRPNRTDRLQFQASHRTYLLSDDAQETAPDAEGSDFAFSYAALTYATRGITEGLGAPYALDATLGTSWYGGAPLMRFFRLGGAQHVILGDRTAARLSVSREWQAGETGRADAQVWSIGADLTHALESGAQLGLGLRHLASASDDSGLDYHRSSVSFEYRPAEPVLGVDLAFGLGLSRRMQDASIYSSEGRDDSELRASVTATFRQIDYYGFVPTATLSAKRVDSNIGLYDSEEIGIELGIRSAF